MPFPYTFTFYSYKGGVGRSLALLNTAYVLSSWGRHVLIVDMDLEAPGVGGLLTRLGELSAPPAQDLFDLLSQARTCPAEELPPVSTFIRSVLPEKLAPLKPKLGESGRVDVLAPDMDRDFTNRLANLGIQDLDRDQIIDLGQKIHTYFKRQRFLHRPLGIEDFEDPIQTPYDYILVDSRTGLTEIGGLCVGPLADRLVVLSGLNDQNINGTKLFLNEVGIKPNLGPKELGWDDADPNEKGEEIQALGPKPTIVVASPVPMGEIEFKRERLSVLQKEIGIKPLLISYHPRLALMETIFVRDFTDEPPTADYIRLADRVTAQVEDSSEQLARLASEGPVSPIDGPQALRLLAQRPEMAPVVLFGIVTIHTLELSWKRRIMATLAQSKANRAEMLSNWALAALEEADSNSLGLGTLFATVASAKSEEAIRLKPNCAEAFFSWGNALSILAKTMPAELVNPSFAQAFEKYAEATRINPVFADAYKKWGDALCALATAVNTEQSEERFVQACNKYAEATRIDPHFEEAFNNWGATLIEAGTRANPLSKDNFFEQAREKLNLAGNLGLYNLACLEARQENVSAAINLLKELVTAGRPLTAEKIDADSDFEAVRHDPNFVAYIAQLRQNTQQN